MLRRELCPDEFVRFHQRRLFKTKHSPCGTASAFICLTEMNRDDASAWPVDKRRSLSNEVLNYLVEPPEAQGTVEGIAEWWRLRQQIETAVGNVEAVLGDLVQRGYLLSSRHHAGRCCYRLNREKEREIRNHLRNPGESRKTLAPPETKKN